jgi:hypothetical protein
MIKNKTDETNKDVKGSYAFVNGINMYLRPLVAAGRWFCFTAIYRQSHSFGKLLPSLPGPGRSSQSSSRPMGAPPTSIVRSPSSRWRMMLQRSRHLRWKYSVDRARHLGDSDIVHPDMPYRCSALLGDGVAKISRPHVPNFSAPHHSRYARGGTRRLAAFDDHSVS